MAYLSKTVEDLVKACGKRTFTKSNVLVIKFWGISPSEHLISVTLSPQALRANLRATNRCSAVFPPYSRLYRNIRYARSARALRQRRVFCRRLPLLPAGTGQRGAESGH